MISRVRILPVDPMARRLAGKPAAARASRAAAIAALEADREYLPEDIARGVDLALAKAAQLVVAAASDRPWALGLGYLRDTLAASVLVGLIAYAWAVLA